MQKDNEPLKKKNGDQTKPEIQATFFFVNGQWENGHFMFLTGLFFHRVIHCLKPVDSMNKKCKMHTDMQMHNERLGIC